MISDKTLDETLLEMTRCMNALQALREERKGEARYCPKFECPQHRRRRLPGSGSVCEHCNTHLATDTSGPKLHAAVKRASLDLTRKLADLRAGR